MLLFIYLISHGTCYHATSKKTPIWVFLFFFFPSTLYTLHRYIILISLRQCWEVSLNIFCFCLLPDNRSFSVLAVSTMVRNFSLLFWETVTVFYPPSRSCAGLKWHSISALLLREQNIFFAILTWKKCVCQYTRLEEKKKVSRLTTAVVSFDLQQFQMADLIPRIRLSMEKLTGP